MGCWNATCNISNLPIFAGEKIVVIPLVRIMHDAAATNCCYPTDNFVPLAFPIFGEYNDYGGVENATTFEANKQHLLNMEYFYSRNKRDATETGYEACKDYDSFDDFVSRIICCSEGCYVKQDAKSELHPDGMAEISYMMIHHDLYMKILEEMGSRNPYGRKEEYGALLLQKFKKILNQARENYKLFLKLELEETKNKNVAKSTELLKMYEANNLTHNLFNAGTMLNTNKWSYFSNLLLENDSFDDDILKSLVNQMLLTMSLSSMRKGYHCDSGCGSQSCETRFHVVLANYVLEHVKKLAEKDREESVDSEMPDDGVEETILFSDR